MPAYMMCVSYEVAEEIRRIRHRFSLISSIVMPAEEWDDDDDDADDDPDEWRAECDDPSREDFDA